MYCNSSKYWSNERLTCRTACYVYALYYEYMYSVFFVCVAYFMITNIYIY